MLKINSNVSLQDKKNMRPFKTHNWRVNLTCKLHNICLKKTYIEMLSNKV